MTSDPTVEFVLKMGAMAMAQGHLACCDIYIEVYQKYGIVGLKELIEHEISENVAEVELQEKYLEAMKSQPIYEDIYKSLNKKQGGGYVPHAS